MTTQWTLTAEQFAAAWFETGLDRLPFPFRFTSRFPGEREYRSYQRQFLFELDHSDHTPLRRAVGVLSRPDWRIELIGVDERHDGVEIRVIGAATRSGSGILAVQSPADDGGRVRLRRCRADQLATELVRLLPDPRPGVAAERSYLLEDLASEPHGGFNHDPTTTTRHRYLRFWNQPSSTRGTICVLLGPRDDASLRTGRLRWIDADDGRYCEVPANRALMVRPATSAYITRYLDEAIIRARARIDG